MFKLVELDHRIPLPVWYYPYSEKYYVQNDMREYIPYSKSTLKLILRKWGMSTRAQDDEPLSEVDELFADVSYNKTVSFAGRLAGARTGCYWINGKRILVTQSPNVIAAKPNGEFPMIQSVIDQLFNCDIDQRPYIYGWLKKGRQALVQADPLPGQALILAGPRNAGKNLFQDLVTEILGGRAEKPYRYMIGKTEFNSDLFGAEHLCIADEVPFHDMASRRVFGSKIKDMCVNSLQSCHGKHKEALSLVPLWRLSVSVNDEPENLVMLPPLDDSIADKLIMVRVDRAKMPMPTDTPEGRRKFWNAVCAELPYFVNFLDDYEIPEDMKDSRFGIKAFQHPALIEVLQDMSHEVRLLELMDTIVVPSSGSWKGTKEELETALLEDPTYKRQVERLLYYPTALQTYLRRLAKTRPERVRHFRSSGKSKWEVESK